MAGTMLMGPRGNGVMVPACAISPDFSSVGWSTKTQGVNGGATVRSSFSSHKEYVMSWNLASRDSLRPITDMAAGTFGTGLIYFIDPVAADKNVLPEHWAFPAQAALDAPVLVGEVRPAATATPPNALGYPSTSASYAAAATATSLYIPIPPENTLWLGWHGTGVGGLKVSPAITGTISGTPEYPDVLSVTSTTRVNTSYSSSSYVGVDIELVGGANVFSGLIAQILPTGTTPATGGFISGQGNSGCQFEGKPVVTPYSAALDLVGMSARLIESGGWL